MPESTKSYVSSTSEFAVSLPSISESSLEAALELADFKTFMRNSMVTISKIARKAQGVSICKDMITFNTMSLIRMIMKYNKTGEFIACSFNNFRYSNNYFFTNDDNRLIDLLFVLNALNFSLWRWNSKQWTIFGLTGYKALCFAIKRAIEEGRPIWDPNYYSRLPECEVEIIFRSDNNKSIPLIQERVRTLHNIGKILLDKYQGSFVNCIKACKGNALKLRHLLFKDFESFRETVNYEGKEVYIGCKATTLINDLSYYKKVFGETYWTSAIFADYCAPRALYNIKILRYSDEFKTKFKMNKDKPLEHGNIEDIEVRCCSLIACKKWTQMLIKMSEHYMKFGTLVNGRLVDETLVKKLKSDAPNIIDNFLWNHRRTIDQRGFMDTPFYIIKSVYY